MKKYYCFLVWVFLLTSISAQNTEKDKMEQLSFLVGEWIGTSKIYENGTVIKQGAAYEKISFDLNKSILVIELNSEFLQLRTIVNYDKTDQKYYYHRFSKEGFAKYPAVFKDGKLVVLKNKKTKFSFTKTPDGNFQEYGEQLIDGKWIRSFEDDFQNVK
jgi:hypothetical protein